MSAREKFHALETYPRIELVGGLQEEESLNINNRKCQKNEIQPSTTHFFTRKIYYIPSGRCYLVEEELSPSASGEQRKKLEHKKKGSKHPPSFKLRAGILRVIMLSFAIHLNYAFHFRSFCFGSLNLNHGDLQNDLTDRRRLLLA